MYNTNDFWFEIDAHIPESEIDFCKRISLNFANSTKEDYVTTNGGDRKSYGLDSYQSFFFNEASEDYSEHQFFKSVANLLVYTKKHWDYRHVFNRSHVSKITGSLKPHVDFRSCVISIPVHNILYPIHWYDNETDKNMIGTYHYNNMVLINTQRVHGCPENDVSRIIFQIGGFGTDETFDSVKDAISRRLEELKQERSQHV